MVASPKIAIRRVKGTFHLGDGMIFNVSQLMKEPSGSCRTFQIDQDHLLIDGVSITRILGGVKLLRTDMGVWVSAKLDSEVKCSCSRCLADHVQCVNIIIEEECFSLDESDMISCEYGDNNEESFCIAENQILDISDAVGQYFELNAPMNPVCGEGCKGICLTCGFNLNERTCECNKVQREQQSGEFLRVC